MDGIRSDAGDIFFFCISCRLESLSMLTTQASKMTSLATRTTCTTTAKARKAKGNRLVMPRSVVRRRESPQRSAVSSLVVSHISNAALVSLFHVKAYAWEATYTRSWDTVREDESGSLQGAVNELLARGRRRRYALLTFACTHLYL